MEFGKKVKELRLAQKLTKEEFCGDEAELSVRQLTRIERGESMPTLAKVEYIAHRLGVKIGDLTDESFELPERYKELKYLLLRIQTYTNPDKVAERDDYFNEIAINFYANLPDEERVIIDCLQAKSDVNLSSQSDFGQGLLEDYFEQVKQKTVYTINDLILLNLYFMCIIVSNLNEKFYEEKVYRTILKNLIKNVDQLPLDYLFLLNNLFLQSIQIAIKLKSIEQVEETLRQIEFIMSKTQDFQKLPTLCVMEWKYSLSILNDRSRATGCYQKAILFAQMISDPFLESKLTEEWEKDFLKL